MPDYLLDVNMRIGSLSLAEASTKASPALSVFWLDRLENAGTTQGSWADSQPVNTRPTSCASGGRG